MSKAQEKRKVIPFINCFNSVSILTLEEILEWLEDNKYLSDKGIVFRNNVWELFIKVPTKKEKQ